MKSILLSIKRSAILAGLLLFVMSAPSFTGNTGTEEAKKVPDVTNDLDLTKPIRVPLLRPFRYNDMGRRDPFIPLLSQDIDENAPSVASLTLTGIIWDHQKSLAVLEDTKGRGYPMRVGDRLGNATLVGVRNDAAIFRVVLYGEVHMHTLKLQPKEEM